VENGEAGQTGSCTYHHFVKFGPTFGILLSIAFNHVAKADGTDVICALFILQKEKGNTIDSEQCQYGTLRRG